MTNTKCHHENLGYCISCTWEKATTARMKPGGDLYRRPLTREEMNAPLAWHESQMASVYRYGIDADGQVRSVKIK